MEFMLDFIFEELDTRVLQWKIDSPLINLDSDTNQTVTNHLQELNMNFIPEYLNCINSEWICSQNFLIENIQNIFKLLIYWIQLS